LLLLTNHSCKSFMPSFYEFFAGGGMARAGLGQGWSCLFANDFDEIKGKTYAKNWGEKDLIVDDIANITTNLLPGIADLAWASSPCQDLSLAGSGGGLGLPDAAVATRSGTFWRFIEIIQELAKEGRAPGMVVFENVTGAITSHKGQDFKSIARAFSDSGYRFGGIVADAQLFVPQSRKRLFIIGVRQDLIIPVSIVKQEYNPFWHPASIRAAYNTLDKDVEANWIWWDMPVPPTRKQNFIDIIEEHPQGVTWDSPKKTANLLSMMSAVNLAKVVQAQAAGRKVVGGVYKRMREEMAVKVQRAEVRFDNVSGCLRTPSGGSSRQLILVINGQEVKSRLLSPREGARLMGLPDNYILPEKYNDAYHLAGDGVVVPVVRYVAANLLEPIISANDLVSSQPIPGELVEVS
jgi:DNA (cytosine-5)-methyltransferase 1